MTPKDRVKLWKRLLPKLKAEFEAMGVTRCEICGGTFALSFAHRKKRRMISDEQELRYVVLLCQKHHEALEHSGHENMYEAITKIWEDRNNRLNSR